MFLFSCLFSFSPFLSSFSLFLSFSIFCHFLLFCLFSSPFLPSLPSLSSPASSLSRSLLFLFLLLISSSPHSAPVSLSLTTVPPKSQTVPIPVVTMCFQAVSSFRSFHTARHYLSTSAGVASDLGGNGLCCVMGRYSVLSMREKVCRYSSVSEENERVGIESSFREEEGEREREKELMAMEEVGVGLEFEIETSSFSEEGREEVNFGKK